MSKDLNLCIVTNKPSCKLQ